MEANDRAFYAWVLIVFGTLAGALGWLAFGFGLAITAVGVPMIIVGLGLSPRPKTLLAAATGLALSLWPATIAAIDAVVRR